MYENIANRMKIKPSTMHLLKQNNLYLILDLSVLFVSSFLHFLQQHEQHEQHEQHDNILSTQYFSHLTQPMMIRTKNGIKGRTTNGKTSMNNILMLPLIDCQKRGFKGKNIKVVKTRSVSIYPLPDVRGICGTILSI